MQKLARMSWVVYAKKPFQRVDHLLAYLGRYTRRVGIANSRLVDVRDDAVTFRIKQGQTSTLSAVEFLRRFVQHVLPGRASTRFATTGSTRAPRTRRARRRWGCSRARLRSSL